MKTGDYLIALLYLSIQFSCNCEEKAIPNRRINVEVSPVSGEYGHFLALKEKFLVSVLDEKKKIELKELTSILFSVVITNISEEPVGIPNAYVKYANKDQFILEITSPDGDVAQVWPVKSRFPFFGNKVPPGFGNIKLSPKHSVTFLISFSKFHWPNISVFAELPSESSCVALLLVDGKWIKSNPVKLAHLLPDFVLRIPGRTGQ